MLFFRRFVRSQSILSAFSPSADIRCDLSLNDTSYSKVFEEVNRKCPVRNTTAQLSTQLHRPERHNTLRHRQTDRQTDDSISDNSRSYAYCMQRYDRLKLLATGGWRLLTPSVDWDKRPFFGTQSQYRPPV